MKKEWKKYRKLISFMLVMVMMITLSTESLIAAEEIALPDNSEIPEISVESDTGTDDPEEENDAVQENSAVSDSTAVSNNNAVSDNNAVSEEPVSDSEENDVSDQKEDSSSESSEEDSDEETISKNDAPNDSEDVGDSPFSQEEKFDNAMVRVEADPGVFPKDAYMTAVPLKGNELAKVEDSVDESASDRNEEFIPFERELCVFDIVIHDKNGNEIQPNNDKGTVRVSIIPANSEESEVFSLFRVEDDGDITFLESEKGEEGSMTADAEHFTLYGAVLTPPYSLFDSITTEGKFDSSFNANDLTSAIIDDGITATSSSKSGTVYKFNKGRQDLGFYEGVVLDTSGVGGSGSTDPELQALINSVYPEGTRYGGDTSTLTMTLRANGSNMNFEYLFASQEFDQEEKYTDVMGIFVKRNSWGGGKWQRVSTLGNSGAKPFTIKNLRAGINGDEMDGGTGTDLSGTHSLFRTKNIGSGYQTNGISSAFTSFNITATPGELVTVKFAIADVSDTSRNSYLFIKGKSLNFDRTANEIEYLDENNTQVLRIDKKKAGERYTIKDLPSDYSLDGRRFKGWKVYGGTKVYQPGEEYTDNKNLILVPQFEVIAGSVRLTVLKDDAPYVNMGTIAVKSTSGTSWISLKETEPGVSGVYTANDVPAGQYTVYVSGWFNYGPITVPDGGAAEATIKCRSINIDTKLDGTTFKYNYESYLNTYIGDANGNRSALLKHYYILQDSNNLGVIIQEDDKEYSYYIDGVKRGTVTASTGQNHAVANYTKLQLTIHNDAGKMSDTSVQLKDTDGKIFKYLLYDSDGTDVETDAVYSAVVPTEETDSPKEYSVFVGDLDTGIKMSATTDGSKKEADFYTASVSITGPDSKCNVTMDNGVDKYDLSTSDSGTTRNYSVARVYKRVEDSSELNYSVSIRELTDLDTDLINSSNKNLDLTYHKVVFYRYKLNDDKTYNPIVGYTEYVRNNMTASTYGTFGMKGFTSLGWGVNQWSLDAAASLMEPYDFSTPVTEDKELYAWYSKPGVEINGIIQCGENGSLESTGWYCMPNATIYGFDPGARAIRYLQIDTENTDEFRIDTTGMPGTTVLTPAGSGSDAVKTITGSESVMIDFGETATVSMLQAQSFLRKNIRIKPKSGAHKITVTVRDSDSTFVEPSYETSVVRDTSSFEKLSESNVQENTTKNLVAGGHYFISNDYHFNSDSPFSELLNASNESVKMGGLTIPDNGTVYLYLHSGGAFFNGVSRVDSTLGIATAGIRLPENAKLVIYGGGKLKVKGGDNYYYNSSNRKAGGSGAAGIGENGIIWGDSDGSKAGTMGKLYVETNNNKSVFAICSSGTSSRYGAAIGSGRGKTQDKNGAIVPFYVKSAGLVNHQQDSDSYWNQGELLGATDTLYSAASPAITTMRPSYTVTYKAPDNTAISNLTQTYYHGEENGTAVTLPNYTPTDGSQFVGWQLVQAAHPFTGETASLENLNKIPGTAEIETTFKDTTLTIPEGTYGNIIFKAIVQKIGGVNAADEETRTFDGGSTPDTLYTYKVKVLVDGTADTSRGTIRIGNQDVSADEDGIYTLVSTTGGSKNIVIEGKTVGTVVPDTANPAEVKFKTLKVSVIGKKPLRVTLKKDTTAGPVLTEEAADEETVESTGYLWDGEYPESQWSASAGPFDVYVDGVKTGTTVNYSAEATIRYYTLTVNVIPTGLETTAIRTVELREDTGGERINLAKQADNDGKAVFSVTGLDKGKAYKIYVNGEVTDTTAEITDGTKEVTYILYTTTVTTRLNGAAESIGEVSIRFGTETEKMNRTGTGTYSYISGSNTTGEVYVEGEKVYEGLASGATAVIDYYTITYAKSGNPAYSGSETGTPPTDENHYLKGTKATLLNGDDLTNGARVFGGWEIGSTKYDAGDEVTMNSAITAKACWDNPSLDDGKTTVSVADNWFVYDGNSHIPEITVSRNGAVLAENIDYELSFTNTNASNGLGANNTINAGDITVTIKGKGDYSDKELTNKLKYTIHEKDLRLTGLTANSKEFNGKKDVVINTEEVTLTGITGSDVGKVSIKAGSTGKLSNPDAGEDLAVELDVSNLEGAASSNYNLRPSDPVLVNVTKRTLAGTMFEFDNPKYNAGGSVLDLTLHDIVDGNNILQFKDFTTTYTDNRSVGLAHVTISAAEDGNYKNPVSGPIVRDFVVELSKTEIIGDPVAHVGLGTSIAPKGNYTYKWLSGSDIVGTSDSYIPKPSDIGKTLTLKVYDSEGTEIGSASTAVVRSLQDYLNDSETDKDRPVKVTLTEDMAGGITIPSGFTVLLDLNGKTITDDINVKDGAKLTMLDSSDEKTGKATGNISVEGDINIDGKKGTLIIEDGKYDHIPSGDGDISIVGGYFKENPNEDYVSDPCKTQDKAAQEAAAASGGRPAEVAEWRDDDYLYRVINCFIKLDDSRKPAIEVSSLDVKSGDIISAESKATDLNYEWYQVDSEGNPVGNVLGTEKRYTINDSDVGKKLLVKVIQTKDQFNNDLEERNRPSRISDMSVVVKKSLRDQNVKIRVIQKEPGSSEYEAEVFYCYGNPEVKKELSKGLDYSYTVSGPIPGDLRASVTITAKNGSNYLYSKEKTINMYQVNITGQSGKFSAPVVGDTLLAKISTAGAQNVTYKWYRDGVLISGASNNTYTLTQADIDKKIRVEAVVSNDDGDEVSICDGTLKTLDINEDDPDTWYSINGKLSAGTGYILKSGNLTITRGKDSLAETIADDEGNYSFENIPKGLYNLVVSGVIASTDGSKTEEVTKTIMVRVDDSNVDVDPIILVSIIVSSKVVIGDDCGETVVKGADEVAEEIRNGLSDGQRAEVVIMVEKKEKEDIEDAGDIQKKAEEQYGSEPKIDFFDFSVESRIDGQETTKISKTEKILMFMLAYDMSGRKDIRVYRKHSDEVQELTALSAMPDSADYADGTFYIDEEEGLIFIFSSRFSTYAITYQSQEEKTEDDSGNTPSSNQETSEIDAETLKIDAGGRNYSFTFTNKIIYDGRKHMVYTGNKAPANTKKKAYDLKVVITEEDGTVIDPKLINVTAKKNKNVGIGYYRIRLKGKKYKALNKELRKKTYKNKLKFEIAKYVLDSKNMSIIVDHKVTKITKVYIIDSDGNIHRLSKKDYEVKKIDAETKTVMIQGKRNTEGIVEKLAIDHPITEHVSMIL
ncbi:MAG: choice-of-anchor L domain-containing protein [Lachnospiraceae bacterium]|nr:choice-of-anchor L domain-containing protein [Lachnospiraceae bacterium]